MRKPTTGCVGHLDSDSSPGLKLKDLDEKVVRHNREHWLGLECLQELQVNSCHLCQFNLAAKSVGLCLLTSVYFLERGEGWRPLIYAEGIVR